MLVPIVNLPPLQDENASSALGEVAHLSIANDVQVLASNETLDATTSDHGKTLTQERVILGPFLPSMIDAATTWLNNGVGKAIVDVNVAEVDDIIGQWSSLPADRLAAKVQISLSDILSSTSGPQINSSGIENLAQAAQKLQSAFHHLILVMDNAADVAFDKYSSVLLEAIQPLRKIVKEPSLLIIEGPFCNVKPEAVGTFHAKAIHVSAAAAFLPSSEQELNAAECYVSCLRSDRDDGLFTTVVADARGVAIGLVYSSSDSVKEALQSKRGVYFSRSRNQIWRKGETSGAVQQLLQVAVDCDSDALRFMVAQSGPGFCHLETATCWGPSTGLSALNETLEQRKGSAPEGSYTKRLFNDKDLLRAKLVEEAQELAEAETKEDVAGEAADVMYFAMARCIAAGVDIHAVERKLDERARKVKRRPGNSKQYRIDAANAILGKKE